jgi:GLPGLI family protein
MKQLLLLLFCILLFAQVGHSQTSFIKKGNIEFERKTNTYRLYFSGEESSFWEEFKKSIPQFKIDYFNLVFNEGRSVYKPGKQNNESKNEFFESPASENTVYKDFNQQISISQKQVFESQFLLSDSLKNSEWKLLPETRTIAGFLCRKALTKICDSVVVVAFYTNEIIPSGGPESFGGLPGMIMELAIPRLYTTWTATRLEQITETDEKMIMPPSKGKKANQKEMAAKVNEGIKDWGQFRDRSLWFVTL